MDCLMMLALASHSLGYQGRGDFAFEREGRIRRRRVEQEMVPFAFTGVSLAHPRLFDGSPDGAFSLNACGTGPSRRGGPMACAWRAPGCTSARPRRWRKPSSSCPVRSWLEERASRAPWPGRIFAVCRRHGRSCGAGRGLVRGNLPVAGRAAARSVATCRHHAVPADAAGDARAAGGISQASGGAARCCCPGSRRSPEGSEDLDLIASVGDSRPAPAGAAARDQRAGAPADPHRLVLRWAAAEARQPSATAISALCRHGAAHPGAGGQARPGAGAADRRAGDRGHRRRQATELVPEEFSEHWSRTLAFLQIVTQFWPAHLAEHGLVSAVAHRKRLLQAEAERLRAAPPAGAGDRRRRHRRRSGRARLIRPCWACPTAPLVLPALDQTLDEESWDSIAPTHPEHPQFGMRKLLDALGLARERGAAAAGRGAARRRRRALVARLRGHAPGRHHRALASFRRRGQQEGYGAALAGMRLVEAATAEEEAETIALMLREAAETPGQTAALITPDRALARRVAARLEVWDLVRRRHRRPPFADRLPARFSISPPRRWRRSSRRSR